MSQLVEQIKTVLKDVGMFVEHASGLRLREYQVGVALAVAESVIYQKGMSFVVMFPRQSGKNELQAQIETYFLTLLSQQECEMVKISPTWKPQSLNAMRRLERVLENNVLVKAMWKKESGYIFRVGRARMFFFSGSPEANIVGATAGRLLEVDEAQDVLIAKFDKDIAPMAASTNATRIFWGTAWTSDTLLARELRAAREAEKRDGCRRVFVLTAEDVSREVPAYGSFVAEQVGKLGRNHPMVRTQFFSEEIDGEGGLFPESRRALMMGNHARQVSPGLSKVYAMLLDVAGEEEGSLDGVLEETTNAKRDATALTIVEVSLDSMRNEFLKAPSYLVVFRKLWVGVAHTRLYGEILALARLWDVKRLVVDATGVGAGLSSFLERALPERVIQFRFNTATKSQLGWDFLAVIDSGRYREYVSSDLEQEMFWNQLSACQYSIVPGVERRMKWGVPDGMRDTHGEYVHDDLVISSALCAVLDLESWSVSGDALVVPAVDPIRMMDKEGF
ncbi:MAG: hypothetical protein ACYDH1_01545 [Anaerolineaceae bacterium]